MDKLLCHAYKILFQCRIHFYFSNAKKITSTSVSEQKRKIRHRSRVIGFFPTIDSWVRLETRYPIEYSEDWETNRSYIKPEKIQEDM
jgi:hypothetical protein